MCWGRKSLRNMSHIHVAAFPFSHQQSPNLNHHVLLYSCLSRWLPLYDEHYGENPPTKKHKRCNIKKSIKNEINYQRHQLHATTIDTSVKNCFPPTCILTSHNFSRLWSKHITDQPDVTTTSTCFRGSFWLYDLSMKPVAIATALLPDKIRTLSGKRDTCARTRASENPSSTRLVWGSKT